MSTIQPAVKKYESYHYSFGPGDYSGFVAKGRRFFSMNGLPLATVDEVRAAMKRDGIVVSR